MVTLPERIAALSGDWSSRAYPYEEYPAIAEILQWSASPDGSGFQLRPPQLRALEAYWFLRLVEQTPRIFDLYKKYFPTDDPDPLLVALGIPDAAFKTARYKFDILWENIQQDDSFVRQYSLEALRETLQLQYPSYILALAMGAGKTALIGAIVASEFGMALEYPDGPFVQNALVFAPGTTILGALRQIAAVPYERILPPRIFKQFAATVKLIFTRDGERDIPVIKGSVFNVVVTNTEKIRIQRDSIRKGDLGVLLGKAREEEARTELANLRLQSIASLPHLGVFSDEAHHTYGQVLGTELKKVRTTVDYLYNNAPNLICVINTTGTPYFKKQPLRDVVIWYPLSQGIADNVLKTVGSNIHAYNFDGDSGQVVAQVVEDFFAKYKDVTLPDGSPAKLAMYFPQVDDVRELRPAVERKLVELGLSTEVVLECHSDSGVAEHAAFERVNDPLSPHRVVLLVNMGTEGWNVPSLFACALARKLKTSNNFVLQAASRCLRQVPGNNISASIYLSPNNLTTLDSQLKDTYGESLEDLKQKESNSRSAKIVIRKLNIPPLVIKQIIRTVVRKELESGKPLRLVHPGDTAAAVERTTFVIAQQVATRRLLKQVGDSVELEAAPDTVDIYAAAIELAACYRLEEWAIIEELRRVYEGVGDVPVEHLWALCKQIEVQISKYEVKEELVERALALVKKDGFDRGVDAEGNDIYTAEIRYPISREGLIIQYSAWQGRSGGKAAKFGFHYTPYNFDSNPELSFFESLFDYLGLQPANVEDIYFTGAITDPLKSDFFVEYLGEDGSWHRYTPDFVIRRKDGRCLIVEIKAERERNNAVDGEQGTKALALRRWEKLNPDKLRYQMLFVKENTLTYDQTKEARMFVEEIDAGQR